MAIPNKFFEDFMHGIEPENTEIYRTKYERVLRMYLQTHDDNPIIVFQIAENAPDAEIRRLLHGGMTFLAEAFLIEALVSIMRTENA